MDEAPALGQNPRASEAPLPTTVVRGGPSGAHSASTPLSLRAMLWYCLANFGYGAFFSFNNAALPLFMKSLTGNNIILGLMGSTHSVEGAVIQPIVGSWSDHFRSRWGRRRPFMLMFVPLSALFLLLTPAASHLPASARLGTVIGCVFLFTVTFNIGYDPYQSLLPDITPVEQRGRVTSVWSLVGLLGQVLAVLAPVPISLKFLLVAGLMIVTTLATCVKVPEPPAQGAAVKRAHVAELFQALIGLRTLHQAARAILVFFFSGLGIGAVLPFLTLFVVKITGCSDHRAELLFLVLMISTAAGVLPFGWLADRIGAKSVVMIGFALLVAAALNGLWVTSYGQLAVVFVVAGLGNAAQSASSYPLLTSLVPRDEVGFYTGLQSTALSIAQPVTVMITGVLVNRGGYRWIFAVCAVAILIGLAVLATLRPGQAPQEIQTRMKEMAECCD